MTARLYQLHNRFSLGAESRRYVKVVLLQFCCGANHNINKIAAAPSAKFPSRLGSLGWHDLIEDTRVDQQVPQLGPILSIGCEPNKDDTETKPWLSKKHYVCFLFRAEPLAPVVCPALDCISRAPPGQSVQPEEPSI
jgi:hypothetical protein